MGAENGPGMFSQLQAQIENYNQQNAEQGGKANFKYMNRLRMTVAVMTSSLPHQKGSS